MYELGRNLLNLKKNLQAIRMADVKAITDCRTLTLQAEDFVELLLVV
jgi:CRP-like cAMP-binding protein